MKETDKVRFVFASEETALTEKLKLLLSEAGGSGK